VENPQFSLFWATTFWQQVAHLWNILFFIHVNMEVYVRRKQCLRSPSLNFMQINATCKGRIANTNMQLGVTIAKPSHSPPQKKQHIPWGSQR